MNVVKYFFYLFIFFFLKKKKKKKKKYYLYRYSLLLNMNLGYSSSSLEETPKIKRPKHKKIKKKNNETTILIPDLLINKPDSEGRTRHVAHTKGLWSGHVYIDVPLPDDIIRTGHSHGWKPQKSNTHLSVSKQLYFHENEINDFARQLSDLQSLPPVFELTFSQLETFTNEEQTTHFLAIKTHSSSLDIIVNEIDIVLKSLSQPTFFKNPSFHVSIASCQTNIPQPPSPKPFSTLIRSIKLVVGNKHFSFPLSDPNVDDSS